MGDFLLDCRPPTVRQIARAADLLRFTGHTRSVVLEEAAFSVALTFTGDEAIWSPYRAEDGTLLAVAGMVALDESQWEMGNSIPGVGGLASKALYAIYRKNDLEGLEGVSGNRVILLYAPGVGVLHVVTDAMGAFPTFRVESGGEVVLGSHPDVTALTASEGSSLDEVSLAEFLLTSTVTPPHTYYRRVKAVPCGTTFSMKCVPEKVTETRTRCYIDLTLAGSTDRNEDELAEELASSIRSAVRRRTSPRFGRTAVALSGGLDSRAVLACVENKENVFAFCCYNEPNRELAIASAIASSLQVAFLPWQRDFEYYGRNAEAGSRISGAMGTFANNHFLGVADRLRSEGAQNLLTGCYFDYLFKGLPLNRRTHWLTGREELAPFHNQFYFTHYLRPSPLAAEVQERLQARVPEKFRSQESDEAIFQVEAHRTFPLCYEGDNQQRVIPQRITGWYLPIADGDVLNVYRKIPWRYKLNRSIYTKAVRRLCDGHLANVPDANTGAKVGASMLSECLHHNWSRVARRVRLHRKSIATDNSWPDWHAYVRGSQRLRAQWKRPNGLSSDFFRKVLTPKDVRQDVSEYPGEDIWLLIPMLTLKFWFEQWHS